MDISPLPSTAPQPVAPVAPPATAAQPGSATPAPAPSLGGTANPPEEKIAATVNRINDAFAQQGQNLYAAFEKDKATGISVIKIVDRKTNETVRQVPIKEMLAFARSLEQPDTPGKLLDATA